MDSKASGANDVVQSLVRGLSVIKAFDAEHPVLSLSEVSRRTEISPAAAGRFLRTLEHLGYVRSDGREFQLTPKVLELGFSYLSSLSLTEVMQPHLESLSRSVNESVSATVLADQDVVYIARVVTKRIMSVAINIGTRFPAYATSMGRVLLAGAPEADLDSKLAELNRQAITERTITDVVQLKGEIQLAAKQGYALVDQELEEGLRSIAAPIFNSAGKVQAAINISTSASRTPKEVLLNEFLPQLIKTAEEISFELKMV